MRTVLALFFMLTISITAQAQTVTVRGTVTSVEDGQPLHVSIVVKGTTIGRITDLDGNYSIDAEMGDVLIFYFYGMTSKEVSVTSSEINVELNTQQTGTFKDPRDGKTYKTAKMGEQVWMAENLAYKPNSGKYLAYDNNISNVAKYGYFYDWQTACNVCPTGWRLPSIGEWRQLENFVTFNAGNLKAKNVWDSDGPAGTDLFGFSALPAGGYDPYFGFEEIGNSGYWWSSTEHSNYEAMIWCIINDYRDDYGSESAEKEELLMSVRCVMQQTGTFKDQRDGKTYKTVIIGEQTWMAENLAYKPGDGNYWAYGNISSNVAEYGYLYDWQTACNVCPPGWRLPSRDECIQLRDFVGSNNVGTRLKATSGWNNNGNGTDDYGFSALPGGMGDSNGTFGYDGSQALWWSTTESDDSNAWIWALVCSSPQLHEGFNSKGWGFSVRCLKD